MPEHNTFGKNLTVQIPMYQVDAFASELFSGNPAAICVLSEWLPQATMLAIAAENNLSETAFMVIPRHESAAVTATTAIELRWFTPTVEVDLCGHATLAAGHVVLQHLWPHHSSVSFSTRSGPLTVHRSESGGYEIDLPADVPGDRVPDEVTEAVASALGAVPTEVLHAASTLARFETAEQVRALRPDFAAIAALDEPWIMVTAPGTGIDADVDFVSRYFAPGAGINEDPVTGSAHCALGPYWAQQLALGTSALSARQVSERGGELLVMVRGNRVVLRGECVEFFSGTILVPGSV